MRYVLRGLLEPLDCELVEAEGGAEAITALQGELTFDVVITDLRMPKVDGFAVLDAARALARPPEVVMITAHGSERHAVDALHRGAVDYFKKPFEPDDLTAVVRRTLRSARLRGERDQLADELALARTMVFAAPSMTELARLVSRVGPLDVNVLITGESGTGKELVARAIYHNSQRNDKPYLPINCAAIPENLLESELFGHEKGSFTGANSQRIGKFEQCDKGTLFLDEIGDMTLATQAKILRVLQNGTIERVGGNKPIKVDVRIIAATNKRLEEAVAAKEFREDLFYRLNVVRVSLPPLRERPGDIPLLIDYFLNTIAQAEGRKPKSILEDAQELLVGHDWPGNVRELENVMRRTIVMAKGDAIRADDLPSGIRPGRAAPAGAGQALGQAEPPPATANDLGSIAATLFHWAKEQPDIAVLPAVERELIAHALRETNGNQVRAAKLLGITRATLRKRIEKFGIKQAISVE